MGWRRVFKQLPVGVTVREGVATSKYDRVALRKFPAAAH